MYSVSSVTNKIYFGQANAAKTDGNQVSSNSVFSSTNTTATQPYFAAAQPTINTRTQLNAEETQKYSKLSGFVDPQSKKQLEKLLKNGVLLSANSNDKSTVLDNLYKTMTNQRAEGLDPKVVLKETINTIDNPFVITQNFGDVPKNYQQMVVKKEHESSQARGEKTEETTDVKHSGDCVAASIEFNLAKQMPAEFARFSEQLTSPKVAVEKTIQTKNLANNTLDAVWLLNAFEVPYKMDNFDNAKLTLAPDKNAILRAQIQNSNKDRGERSLVDVLMQSTFMNVGSQQSYDSLTDIRAGKFNQDKKGLIEFEKTFTESIVEDKNKISVTYQTVDENGKLVGYETDLGTMKKHILDSIALGENVIIGYTQVDKDNKIINGHEITIVGAKEYKKGKYMFICNDTDDGISHSIAYSEDYLLPKIHHAGLPQRVVEKDVQFVDNWVNGINAYKEAKNQQKA